MDRSLSEYDTFEEAKEAVAAQAMISQSISSPAMLYKQGNRHFILTTFKFSDSPPSRPR